LDPAVDVFAELPLRDESRTLSILDGGNVAWETELPEPPRTNGSIIVANSADDDTAEVLTVTSEMLSEGRYARIDYSCDGGTTWQTVVKGGSRQQLQLDTSGLPGGEACHLRVVVTDGYRVRQSVSKAFQVRRKPTLAAVVAPRNGVTVRRGETVRLFGETVGLGRRGDPAGMNWSSSIDGFLGSGDEVLVHTLARGRHRITLAADDGIGGECTADIFLHVVEDEDS